MTKQLRSLLMLCLLGCALGASAIGWPAGHKGVMLQGFYWDSYSDTKWTNLTAQADELSASFNLIWIPNSAYAGGSNNMGYMPQYWFTRHNSSFGTEAQLAAMMETFSAKGTRFIADVVVNHRCGTSNWTNFPAEEWNGTTWKLGPEHICCTDEVRNQPGQATPTGAPDTGEDFDGARDLDHTSSVVQNNIKNYCKCLLEKYGYAGFRYDMVKGYAGRFTKIYNQYSRPTYSVGEYWDGNYDAVAAWIEATGRESAAFDFPGKYAINEAFHSNDMTKLVWMANGSTPQPAGLIHFGYAQLAVTFVDNHDTYRDGSKFNGNVPAANAFIISSPGTPCVFLPHWKAHKAAIQKMIKARNDAGVTNTSAVTVLKTTRDCYMAKIQGTNGTLAVRIGSTNDVPSGFSGSDLRVSGTGYAIWVSGVGGGGDNPPTPPVGDGFNIYFDNSVTNWSSVKVHYWGASESTWPGVAMTLVENNVYKYTLPAGTTGVVFNNGSGAQTDDVTGLQPDHLYKPVSTSGKPACTDMGVYGGGGGGGGTVEGPANLYILGNIKGAHWTTSQGIRMTGTDGEFSAEGVEFETLGAETVCYFNLTDALGADWDELNATANRYGAPDEGTAVTLRHEMPITLYANGIDASNCKSWTIPAGKYNLLAKFPAGTLTITPYESSGIENIGAGADVPAEYYNLQGIRVENPAHGIFIMRRGSQATRVYIP